jgi:hypothetical protein
MQSARAMRSPTLRRTLLALLEASLVSTAVTGCVIVIDDDDDRPDRPDARLRVDARGPDARVPVDAGGIDAPCYLIRTAEYRLPEPPPTRFESLIRACESDVAACLALCEEVHGHAYWLQSCDVVHSPTEHVVTVEYTEWQNQPGCPVPGRRPAGLCDAASRATSAVGAYLARAAWFERASVHAFVELARQLTRHQAPARLIQAALRAALDEVRHAAIMGRLAQAHGATPPPVDVRPPARRSLTSIAIENATEGCVGETWAALVAMWQAQRATDPDIQAAFAAIAGDELRHAELSWELDSWLREQLPAAAQRRVHRARQRAIEALGQNLTTDTEVAAALGLPDVATATAMFERTRQALWA